MQIKINTISTPAPSISNQKAQKISFKNTLNLQTPKKTYHPFTSFSQQPSQPTQPNPSIFSFVPENESEIILKKIIDQILFVAKNSTKILKYKNSIVFNEESKIPKQQLTPFELYDQIITFNVPSEYNDKYEQYLRILTFYVLKNSSTSNLSQKEIINFSSVTPTSFFTNDFHQFDQTQTKNFLTAITKFIFKNFISNNIKEKILHSPKYVDKVYQIDLYQLHFLDLKNIISPLDDNILEQLLNFDFIDLEPRPSNITLSQ